MTPEEMNQHARELVAGWRPLDRDELAAVAGSLHDGPGVTLRPPTREQRVVTWVSKIINSSPQRSVARAEFFRRGVAAGITEQELITACQALGFAIGRRRIVRAGGSPRQFPHQPGATKVEADTSRTAVRDDRTRQRQRPRTSHAECDHEATRNARQKCLRDRERAA